MLFFRDRRHLILLGLVVVARIALIAYVYPDRDKMFNGDSDLYDGLAVSIVEEGRYYFEPYEPRSDLIRTPGFPLFIAANYLVFGQDPLFPILWNIVLVVGMYLLMERLLRRFNAPSTLAPFLILTVDLAWLLYSKELLTEPLFTVLLLGTILLTLEARDKGDAKRGFMAGALLGLSALVKPITLYLPLFLVPYMVLRRYHARAVLGFLAAFVVLVAPWFVRNKIVHDSYTYTSIQSHNLLFAHGAFVYADAHDITHRAAQDSLFLLLEARLSGAHDETPFAEVEAAEEQLAAEILSAHPVLYARAMARGALVTLFDPGRLVFNRTFPSDNPREIGFTNTVAAEGLWKTFRRLLEKDTALVVSLMAYLAFLVGVNALALVGIRPFYRTSPAAFALITLVVLYLLLLGGPNGYARFRLYVFPLLLVYADFGWAAMRAWLSRHFHSRSLSRPSST